MPVPHHSNFYRPDALPEGKLTELSTEGKHIHVHTYHNRFTALFLGPPGCAGARRELLDFMVQGKINRGRHTEIQLGGTPSGLTSAYLHHPPHSLQEGCPAAAQPTASKH